MNRLLKESSQKTVENRQQKLPKETLIGNNSLINREIYQIDSTVDALEPNRITTFSMRENAVRNQTL
jgi:hypothetical protein